jgi:hypothetical protein
MILARSERHGRAPNDPGLTRFNGFDDSDSVLTEHVFFGIESAPCLLNVLDAPLGANRLLVQVVQAALHHRGVIALGAHFSALIAMIRMPI